MLETPTGVDSLIVRNSGAPFLTLLHTKLGLWMACKAYITVE
jgi:hypothetical protein